VELKPGSRWRSAVCDVEVMVIKAPQSPVALECGGQPLVAPGAPRSAAAAAAGGEGTRIGKRYVDEHCGLELLCVKGGPSALSIGGRALSLKEAKALPSSD